MWRGTRRFWNRRDVAICTAAKIFRGQPPSWLAIDAYAYPLVSFFKDLHLISALKLGNDFSAGLISDVELVCADVLVGWRGYWRSRWSRCGDQFIRFALGGGLNLRWCGVLFADCPQKRDQD
ncbi:hypothetical protein EMIT0P218_30234 [Pseudomonas sp. IT-P218]